MLNRMNTQDFEDVECTISNKTSNICALEITPNRLPINMQKYLKICTNIYINIPNC